MNAESQSAAISRVVALAPQREAIQAALEQIIASPEFASSHRAQLFLRYVVEHALAGELDRLKERVIGSALYGRQPDYDTGTDSIVRVTAAEVRKRLDSHFEANAKTAPVIIKLPVGSYIPEIRLESSDLHPVAAPAVSAPTPTVPRSRWPSLAATGWALALLIALLWLWSARSRPGTAARAIHSLPWTAILSGGPPPQFILADSGIGVIRYLDWFSLSLPVYANRSYLTHRRPLSPEAEEMWDQIAPRAYTSIVDARTAAAYSVLAAAAGTKPVLRFARDLQLSDFHQGENFVLLGSPSSNPWVELFEDQLDFRIKLDDQTRNQKVIVASPKPGDPPTLTSSISSGHTGEAFATLALVRGLDGRGSVLIAQGTTMEGTDVAASLAVTRTDELAAELRRCGIDPSRSTGQFEILLRLDATAGSNRASKILTTRCSQQH
jgi:hypothetical protein